MDERVLARIPEGHPRVLLNERRIAELRQAIQGTHRWIWERLRVRIDEMAERRVPDITPETPWSTRRRPDMAAPPGVRYPDHPFTVWGMQKYGYPIPFTALGYLMTGEARYLEAAKRWMLKFCRLRRWNTDNPNSYDLGFSGFIIGMALGYDWLYNDLNDEERTVIGEKLAEHCEGYYRDLTSESSAWPDFYMQNHLHVNLCAAGITGLTVYGEASGADTWLTLVDDTFAEVLRRLPPDGGWHEGVSYWGFAAHHILKYIDAVRELTGVDHFDNEWLRNTAYYRIYSQLPKPVMTRLAYITNHAIEWPAHFWPFLSFSDPSQGEHGPAILLHKLAAEYRNPYAQWLARYLIEEGLETWCHGGYLNLLWYDPTVEAKPLSELPTARHFEDLGLVFIRSGWGEGDALIGFRCGPPNGHRALRERYYTRVTHYRPDVNSFQLYACGRMLTSYPHGHDVPGLEPRRTLHHSTILVNGVGQRGDGLRDSLVPLDELFSGHGAQTPDLYKYDSHILKFETAPTHDYIVGDGTAIYPPKAGLERFRRHLAFVKPSTFLAIADDLRATRPSQFQWIFNAEWSIEREQDNRFLVTSEDAVLQVDVVFPETVSYSIEERLMGMIGLSVSPQEESEETTFLTLLTPSRLEARRKFDVLDRSSEDGKVSATLQDGEVVRELSFDLKKNRFEVK
jgi:hypothetical protein